MNDHGSEIWGRVWLFLGNWYQSISRVFVAALVIYLFILFLVTSIAQNRVVSNLTANSINMSYSAAESLSREFRENQNSIEIARNDVRDARTVLNDAALIVRRAGDRYQDKLVDFRQIAETMFENCERTFPDLDGREESTVHLILWRFIQMCGSNSDGNAEQRRLLEQGQSQYVELLALADEYRSAMERTQSADVALMNAIDALNTLAERDHRQSPTQTVDAEQERRASIARESETALQEKVSRSFSELDALRNSPLLGGNYLVVFAPAILFLFLTLTAGCLGALLITLVLFVYPNQEVKDQVSPSYFARITLGGIIALCVYIIIVGGSGILGTGSRLAEGEANYMTFCAIGILAGMFSDRAAGWLSLTADGFFRQRRDAQANAQ